MDLLSGLRKGDTTRGGRAEFKWEDVKEDKDRENYLGHSLMAPVGRWQRNKDLTWYAKADSSKDLTAEEQRAAEIRRVKEAEQDALSEALGFPVVRRHHDPVSQDEVQKAIRDAGAGEGDGEEKEEGRGVGFSGRGGERGLVRKEEGSRVTTDARRGRDDEYRPVRKDRDRERERRRSRSRGEDEGRRERRDRRSRSRGGDRDRERRRYRSRSRHGERGRDRRDRDRSGDRGRDRSHEGRRRHGDRDDRRARPRSRSPRRDRERERERRR